MAKIRQRTWKIPGQRTKRKAWGFVTVGEGGKPDRARLPQKLAGLHTGERS